MQKTNLVSLSALALALAALSPNHAAARPMTPQDLATFSRIAAPATSPDGRWVVWQQTETDPETYARTTGLWLREVRANATPFRVGDIADASESAPAFSPDGKRLYFLSGKSGKDQLWFVDLPTGTPVQASDTLADVAGFTLSPDGARVLLWGDVADDCPQLGCETTAQPTPATAGSARIHDQLFVRHWDTWETPGTHAHAFTYPLGADGRVSGAPAAITRGLNGHTPPKPFGGNGDLAWSPDSRTVYFTMRIADAQEPLSTNLDLYAVPADGSAAATNLTAANHATDALPTPSPDGRWLAYAAMARPGYESDRQVVMLRNVATGETRALTQAWDRSVGSIAWAPDGKSIVVTADDTLQHPAFSIDVASGRVTRLTQDGHVSVTLPLPGGAMLIGMDSITRPTELYLRNARGRLTQLTNANTARLAAIDPLDYRAYSFTGANGDTVWGQILMPRGTTAKLPTVLIVHGGPQGSFGNSWSSRWNPATWAHQGFAIVTVDFHGSTGYGQAFTDSINRNWGGWPLEDLQKGFAAAARIDAHVDTANACAAGASYGGYMMNWIAGNWADGFKCLVQHDGVFDARAMAYETEELWFDEWEHGGHAYYEAPQEYERWNPVNHVDKWKTPMLVITGERDYRIPYTQGIAAFTALQRRGIPSRLLSFPDENHWVLKGKNSVQWHSQVFDWIHRWTRAGNIADAGTGGATAATPPAQ